MLTNEMSTVRISGNCGLRLFGGQFNIITSKTSTIYTNVFSPVEAVEVDVECDPQDPGGEGGVAGVEAAPWKYECSKWLVVG